MSKSRDIADSAATINYIDNVTSDVQSQLNTLTTAVDNISVTSGTLTKTFTTGESSTINLTSSVLAPVVSVTKEVPQTGVTNNSWDVNSTAENYTRVNSAPATTLDFVAFGVSTATYSQNFSVSSQDTTPQDIAFNTDGTKMFIVGFAGQDVNEYTLSTGFDVSTATYSQNFSVSAQEATPQGIAFNTDGTKMFIVGYSGDDVNEYTLGTGFDVSTASYSQNFSVSAQDTGPVGIAFNNDGTKMFIVGSTGQDVNEYTLGTGFDVSTATFVDAFSVSSQDTSPKGIAFNTDGTKMFILGNAGDNVNEYTLSTGFDVSTATYSQNFSVSAQDTGPTGIAFNTDGTKMFIVGSTGDDVNEYDLTPTSVTLGTGSFASADVGKTIYANSGEFVLTSTGGAFVETTAPSSYAQVASGDWEMYALVYNTTDGDLELSGTLVGVFDVSTASFVDAFSVSAQETDPSGIAFNNDGTKMFILGYTGQDVNEYTLSTGFDVSTASYSQNFSVSAQETSPTGIAFNTDGTKMFIVGLAGQNVNEYTLGTGFNVSTATFVDAFSVSAQDTNPRGIAFNTDGTKMFIVGNAGDDVNEYTLGTGFDVSTATYSQNFSVATEDTGPFAIAFNTDGTKMFIVGSTGQDVNEYTLGTGFDVSTATFVDAFSVSAQDTNPRGIAFNTDGTKMFIVGTDGDDVNEYTLGTGFDVSTATYSQNFSVSAQEATPFGIAFNANGTKMFIVGDTGDDVNEYDLSYSSLLLGTGSFASADVGKTIYANSGEFILTSTGGAFVETTAPTSYAQVASGNWEMYAVVYNTTDGDLELSGTVVGVFDISTASFLQSSPALSDTLPGCVRFKPDGTKMFVTGLTDDAVDEYDLSTAWDVTTATFNTTFSVGTQESAPFGLDFSPDGTNMYIVGIGGVEVNQYSLSAAWDISTASYVRVLSVSSQETEPSGIKFNPDGTKMFITGATGDDVNEYTLSTAWDISSASFVDAFSVSSQDTSPDDIDFNSDGTKMYVIGSASFGVYEYNLSTAYDVSTASYLQTFSISSQELAPIGLTFKPDGLKMYICGTNSKLVREYNIGATAIPSGYNAAHTTQSTDSTYWTDINSMTADQAAGDGNVYYAISTDDRTTWSIADNTDGIRDIVRNNGGTWQYNSNSTYASETWTNGTTNTELATLAEAMEGAVNVVNAFDVSTASYSQNFSVSAQEVEPTGIAFNNDGTKMFIVGTLGDDVNEYTLSTGFDVSTASYSQNFSVASEETQPQGIAFNNDGTKMFIVGITGDDVNEYTLSTGFDVSTASYSQNFSVQAQESSPQDIAFNTDGTKMFIVGAIGDDVNEYTLGTGFDVSTASYSQNFSVSSQDTAPTGIAFNTDGTKMFIVGNAGEDVNEYTLGTGFDVSTASYSQNFSVASQETSPRGIAFNSDGTKMFIVGDDGNDVNEYTLGSTNYINQMDKTQLDAVTDPNHISLGNDLDLAIIFNLTSGTTVPSSDGVSINYDANTLNEGAILGTDYDFDFPATDKVRITALAANNLKVRVV